MLSSIHTEQQTVFFVHSLIYCTGKINPGIAGLPICNTYSILSLSQDFSFFKVGQSIPLKHQCVKRWDCQLVRKHNKKICFFPSINMFWKSH